MHDSCDIPPPSPRRPILEVFSVFLRLGLTSFGGPVAHLGYFRSEFVERRKWLDEKTYADIVALCQFLPGPASSQVGMILGLARAGLPGALAAWIGFTLPSALAMVAFAFNLGRLGDIEHVAWLHGLEIVAVAVVAQAVWGMGRNLCPDRERITLAVAASLLTLAVPSAPGQIGAILAGAILGWWFLPATTTVKDATLALRVGRATAISSLILFGGLLVGLPLLAALTSDHTAAVVSSFYRAGALVFGGGHVVLPLLQQSVVPQGWVGNDVFLAGYGAAQAVPGPLFTFAAFLGTVMTPPPNGWIGGLVCLVAIFLPSFLVVLGLLPFWDGLRRRGAAEAALKGVNASVVGILLAALYTPVWTSAIVAPMDFGLALLAFLLLVFWQVPSWVVVILGAIGTTMLAGLR